VCEQLEYVFASECAVGFRKDDQVASRLVHAALEGMPVALLRLGYDSCASVGGQLRGSVVRVVVDNDYLVDGCDGDEVSGGVGDRFFLVVRRKNDAHSLVVPHVSPPR